MTMMILSNRPRHRRAVLLTSALFLLSVWFFLTTAVPVTPRAPSTESLAQDFPLTWKHIHSSSVRGGAWYIPPEWRNDTKSEHPTSILEAAGLASKAALAQGDRQIDLSNVPLIVHQTLRSTNIETWKPEILPWVEQWLNLSVDPDSGRPMAYFFWDDDGIFDFMGKFEPDFLADFLALFSPVERADIFRVLVCARFGGVYADVDTEPLRHPATWVSSADVAPWKDNVTGKSYANTNDRPVNLIWGLEADTNPNTDAYWRMGYTYPVQLTQWALASAPRHAVIDQFMENLKSQIREQSSLRADPLTRTGPAAVTKATQMWLEKTSDVRWNALTGLKDGGRSKLVEDIVVFPITAFSPGRGRYGNMGSKPVTHPDARLVHHALGSWRRFDFVVEYGKLCRSSFGLCREWSKVPS